MEKLCFSGKECAKCGRTLKAREKVELDYKGRKRHVNCYKEMMKAMGDNIQLAHHIYEQVIKDGRKLAEYEIQIFINAGMKDYLKEIQ